MIKISAIVGEKLKAVGTSFNKTVAGVSVSKVLASAAILRAGLSYTAGKFFNFLQRFFEDQSIVGDTKYLSTQKGLIDTTGFIDQKNVSFVKRLTDLTQTVDQFSRTVTYSKTYVDQAGTLDNFNRVITFSRTFQNLTQSVEVLKLNTVKSASDISSILDLYSRTVSYNRGFSDVVTGTDDVNGAALDDDQNILFFKVVSDQGTTSDSFNRTVEFFRTYTDNSFTSDELHSVGYVKNTTDNSSATDSYSRTVNYNRNPEDSSPVSDTNKFDVSKPLTDNSDSTDQLSYTYSKNTTDSSTSSDTYSRTVSYNRGFSDVVTGTDDVNGAALDDDQNILFFKVVSDQGTTSDSFNRTVEFFRTYTDNSFTSDELHSVGYVKNTTDNSSATDSYSRTVNYNRTPEEVGNVQESLVFTNTFIRNLLDTAQPFEAVRLSPSKTVADNTGTTDQHFITAQYYRNVTEASSSSDQIDLINTYIRQYTDSYSGQDLARLQYVKNISDTVTGTENFNKVSVSQVGLTESISSTDDVNGAATDDDQNILFFKVIGDTGSLSDTPSLSPTKKPAEASTVSDQGVLLNQSFIDPTYLAEDYVGDSRILT